MPPTAALIPDIQEKHEEQPTLPRAPRRVPKKILLPTIIILAVLAFIGIAVGPLNPSHAQIDGVTVARTSATVQESCNQAYYSHDGNPFQLCPSAYPGGGNCVWWAWEQWHLLGYDLPLNWGNAADWVVDAERAGLPIGTQPRVGAIAVFPRADGVWAYGAAGHVAFVSSVNSDGDTFNVTYQNYGDPRPMYIGLNYPVSVINAARFQRNELRFIYFPKMLDAARFARLPGIRGNSYMGVQMANQQNQQNQKTVGASHPTLGLPGGNGGTEQEFKADFTGTGVSDLLLYNRQEGKLSVVALKTRKPSGGLNNQVAANIPTQVTYTQRVPLSDAKTAPDAWGTNLDVRVGDFAGTGQADILLYDRTNGTMQVLSLTQQLTVKTHVSLAGWGPNWEIYPGRFDGQRTGLFLYNRFANADVPTSLADNATLSNSVQQWQLSGRTANAVILNFNADLSVQHMQQYTQWHNTWEIYVGRYKSNNQDGVFLYDRRIGEVRVMDFSGNMAIADYQELHDLKGNWQVFSGDFNGSGRAQISLYEPSRGMGAFLVLGSDLSLTRRVDYTGWPRNQVFYIGHFGAGHMNVMLYNPDASASTFLAFDDALKLVTKHTVHSWNKNQQILVGTFVDRTACLATGACAKGDDILVLNRKTGQIQQYVFTFGRQYQVINNRARPYAHDGVSSDHSFKTVDTTMFKLVGTFNTNIKNEEVY